MDIKEPGTIRLPEPEGVRDIVVEYHRMATGELPAHRVEESGTRWKKR